VKWGGLEKLLEGRELPATVSPAAFFVEHARDKRGLEHLFRDLTDSEVATLVYDWSFWARPEQCPPEDASWELAIFMAGRGWGKTFAGSKWVIDKAQANPGSVGALVAPTAADVRDTLIRGSSGILALSPPWFLPKYEPSKRRLTWPNGAIAICYSADKPERLRGPNASWAWGDEFASWTRGSMEAFDQLELVCRIGSAERPPQILLTGTPKPLKKLEELLKRPRVIFRSGSSLANAANLAPSTVSAMRALAATRWGRQEVLGELLMDVPGAIFGAAKWQRVEDVDPFEYGRKLDRRIVALDPAPTSDSGSDESGLIVEGCRTENGLKKISILKDATLHGTPREWAAAAIREYLAFQCDALVCEVNAGGELVETTIKTVAQEMGVTVNVKPVRAREAKSKRAEPVSALAETGRIEFVGNFPRLEKQLSTFTGINGRRDDRADAMCWGVHELAFGETFFAFF
jgi:phage terminase large subunit-like protein